MKLTGVTITGADNATYTQQLIELSKEFPFVEWAILVSRSHQGEPRWPDRHWLESFHTAAYWNGMKWAIHLCGSWVRELLRGHIDWKEVPKAVQLAPRVQINTHGELLGSAADYLKCLRMLDTVHPHQFIFQLDGVNDHLAMAAKYSGLSAAGLHDLSHGAGVLPENWPCKDLGFPVGYAGGLSPANVVEQVEKIEQVVTRPYWIDMETRVRTDDDAFLDLKKVRKVLELCAPLIHKEE